MKIRVDKRKWYWTWGILNGILVLLTLACALGFYWVSSQLDSLGAARRWRGDNDMRFAQIACFLREDETKQEDDIFQFRRTLEQKLTEASVVPPPGGKLYADAWSASGKLSVRGDHGEGQAQTIGVGGDFFLFHPLQLRSGSYLTGEDFMLDRVLLDEDLAWQLFGSFDVAGMTVHVGEKPFYVAGVIHREDDFASKKAYRDGGGMFMSYAAFQALTEKGITCYEIVLPDMITGFGLSMVKDNFSVGRGTVLENSSRYSVQNLFQVARDFGVRSMGLSGLIYPYWENAVRLTEDYLSVLLILMLLFAACPVLTALVLGIRTLVRAVRTTRQKLRTQADALVERRKEERYAKMRANRR